MKALTETQDKQDLHNDIRGTTQMKRTIPTKQLKKKAAVFAAAGLLAAGSILSGCGAGTQAPAASPADKQGAADGGKVKLQFFQNKPEAKVSFDALIRKFNAANPGIEVTQVNVPDAETVLKVNVAKNEVPDIVGMGATDTFASLSKSGTFQDLSGHEGVKTVQPAYIDMVKKTTGTAELYGIPLTSNANGIIYNKALFAELGLTVPKTWHELMAAAEKIKTAGKVPFYHTFKDSWTTMISFNSLASNLQPENFIEDRKAGKGTFAEGYKEIAEKQLKLVELGHKDQNGKGYGDGNTAFAKGAAVMYLQGVWAIPEILKANPAIELGSFPFPASNDPAKNKLVSGVDTLLAVSKTTKHSKEAAAFVSFLLQPDNVKQLITEQKSFSAVQGVAQDDKNVTGLNTAFEDGQLVDFADHAIPGTMKIDTIIQEYYFKKDMAAYLKKLDSEWEKVQSRK
ncbi:ABC transporter substrate-binding protein [Paenibacillus mucilaginosus]|uniref:Extracellular solute-binding protein family 1 n=1 Tax=Paenibacillus mucilaginosus (strain KNP414) TaxID=1036673 RepID=F8F4X2_PAEMK|nr:extracellular solute-binding protein [Paenibacillus mucilaginosus]AEI40702.1 extracellular solute-binding protein family 1 [Paenibacillus mucilaginosus KNP414]MCG7211814.1 extracellular solute-binding protein [Paenibacillus mucilaginosus]WDM29837.1 extracellular solute-binding protein [Paenibacillus mucilaginosus]